MKSLSNILVLGVVLVLCAGCGKGESDATREESAGTREQSAGTREESAGTREQFARSMFRALQQNDAEAFLQLCANKDEYIAYLMGHDKSASKESLDRALERAEMLYGDSAELARRRTANFRAVASAINWRQVRLGQITGSDTLQVEVEHQGMKLLLGILDVKETPQGFKSTEDDLVLMLLPWTPRAGPAPKRELKKKVAQFD